MRHVLRWIWIPGLGFVLWLFVEGMPVSCVDAMPVSCVDVEGMPVSLVEEPE